LRVNQHLQGLGMKLRKHQYAVLARKKPELDRYLESGCSTSRNEGIIWESDF